MKEVEQRKLIKDQGGLVFSIPLLIAVVAGIFGISLMSTVNFSFLVPLFAMGTVFIAVVGFATGKIKNFNHMLIIGGAMTALMVFIEIGALTAIGVALVGGGLYYLGPGATKTPALFIFIIASGIALTILGVKFVMVPMGLVGI